MSNLVTSTQIKDVVSPVVAFDPSFFDTSISYIEEFVIKCVLTDALYADMVAKIALLPGIPLSTEDQALYDKIIPAESYAVAFASYEKDLITKTNNQGMMENRTDYSGSDKTIDKKVVLKEVKQREYDYMKALGDFLIANATDYPLFDAESIYYSPNFRRFFPI
jgi:hypothetical protein